MKSVLGNLAFLAIPLGITVLIPSTARAVLVANPNQMSFVQTAGGQTTPPQTVSITSTDGPVAVSASSNVAWLGLSLSFPTTPAVLTVTAFPVGLLAGTYNGTITISGTGQPSVAVAVTLTVVTSAPTGVSPSQLSFVFVQGGSAPPAQAFTVNGSGTTFQVNVDQTWLSITAAVFVAPAAITVSVNPFGLLPGIYTGNVIVTHNTIPAITHVVAVTLQVGGTATLWATNGPLVFNHRFGTAAPPSQQLSVSYITPIFFSADVQSSGWLRLEQNAGITPTTLTVVVDPTGLSAGTYAGAIVLASTSALTTHSVAVTLVVTGAPNLTAVPTSLTFEAPAGGAPPPSKSFSITSSPTTNFNMSASALWLRVNPASGSTPQIINVTADPAGLTPGTYRASIIISAPGASSGGQLVSVVLTVTAAAPISVAPAAMRFDASLNAAPPSAQVLTVTSAVGQQVAVASTAPWLSITPGSGTTPASFSVSVIPGGLQPGMYTGSISITAPGQPSQSIAVVLTIGAAPQIREVSNGAGLRKDFAPGSLVIVFGRDFGLTSDIVATIVSGGRLETRLGGLRLLMNGLPAPLLAAGPTRIIAIVPFELAGQSRMEVQVDYMGVLSERQNYPLDPAAPVLVTADGSGRGQAAAVNGDGSINSPSSPAPRGDVVVVWATGGGLLEFPVATGAIINGMPGPRLQLPVMAFVNGVMAEVIYAGQAPGMPVGAVQFNIRIPPEIAPGSALTLTIKIGDAYFSQPGVTIAVQ